VGTGQADWGCGWSGARIVRGRGPVECRAARSWASAVSEGTTLEQACSASGVCCSSCSWRCGRRPSRLRRLERKHDGSPRRGENVPWLGRYPLSLAGGCLRGLVGAGAARLSRGRCARWGRIFLCWSRSGTIGTRIDAGAVVRATRTPSLPAGGRTWGAERDLPESGPQRAPTEGQDAHLEGRCALGGEAHGRRSWGELEDEERGRPGNGDVEREREASGAVAHAAEDRLCSRAWAEAHEDPDREVQRGSAGNMITARDRIGTEAAAVSELSSRAPGGCRGGGRVHIVDAYSACAAARTDLCKRVKACVWVLGGLVGRRGWSDGWGGGGGRCERRWWDRGCGRGGGLALSGRGGRSRYDAARRVEVGVRVKAAEAGWYECSGESAGEAGTASPESYKCSGESAGEVRTASAERYECSGERAGEAHSYDGSHESAGGGGTAGRTETDAQAQAERPAKRACIGRVFGGDDAAAVLGMGDATDDRRASLASRAAGRAAGGVRGGVCVCGGRDGRVRGVCGARAARVSLIPGPLELSPYLPKQHLTDVSPTRTGRSRDLGEARGLATKANCGLGRGATVTLGVSASEKRAGRLRTQLKIAFAPAHGQKLTKTLTVKFKR
jgi:hypothetical protein